MPKDGLTDGVYPLTGNRASGYNANSSTTRSYLVVGAIDEDDAINQCSAYAPSILNGMVQTDPNADELCHVTGTYRVAMKWGPANAPERERETHRPPLKLPPVKLTDPARWSYRTRAIQEQISATDPARVTAFGPAGNKREDDGAIAVDESTRQIGGCPKIFTGKDWTAEVVYPKASVDQTLLDDLKSIETTTNESTIAFTMFSPGSPTTISFFRGEALYLGSDMTEEDEAIRFHFYFFEAKNETGLNIGTISGIAKDAHDFLWVDWGPLASAAGLIGRTAKQVYVHQIYEPADWSPLSVLLP